MLLYDCLELVFQLLSISEVRLIVHCEEGKLTSIYTFLRRERANTSADRETGIEGILSRLEKERSLTFGFGVAEHDDRTFSASSNGKDDLHSGFSSDAV